MIIMGIDPGTALLGYAVIQKKQGHTEKPLVLDFGCVVTNNSNSAGERLKILHGEITTLIKKHKPKLISVESLFFFKNAKTVMPVAQAKGVVLLAAAQANIPVVEFTPLQVKMTVVGYGRAEKKQVQAMTKQLLDIGRFDLKENYRKKDDAADALGVALCALLKNSVLTRMHEKI